MAEPRSKKSVPTPYRVGAASALTALLLGAQTGCTREFFREWANQDVSEAVFEKSRDPRWRLDTFSIEPPAMSRYADPYDQDFPPAPPDDHPSEALSPVPQNPDNRLMIPVEGTGYVEMLEQWQAERDALPKKPEMGYHTSPPGEPNGPTIPDQPPPPPQPSAEPSPFVPVPVPVPGTGAATPPQASIWKPNRKAGADARKKTPILLADARAGSARRVIPPPRSAASFDLTKAEGPNGSYDGAVRRAARQDAGQGIPSAGCVPAIRNGRRRASPIRT